MRGFGRLYYKELRESLNVATIFGVLSVGWLLFLRLQKWNWDSELVFGLSFLPFGLLPLYLLLKGFTSFRSEWKEDTIYSVLTLPVPGWYFTLSKLLATMTVFSVLTLIFGLGVFVLSKDYILGLMMVVPKSIGIGVIWKVLFLIYLFYWLFSLVNYILSQFSYLVSQLFSRFNGLITGAIFLLSYWFLFRISAILVNILRWIPAIKLKEWGIINGFFYERDILLETAPGIALLLVTIGLLILGSWVLENVLEV